MITDKITNLKNYSGIRPEFEAIAEFIAKNDLKTIECGSYDVCDGVKVSISEYAPAAGGDYECHREYHDLQYAITGGETIKVVPTENGKNFTEYKPDIQFFADFCGNETSVALDEGIFAFLTPDDAHKPCIKADCDTIRKAVFKIKK